MGGALSQGRTHHHPHLLLKNSCDNVPRPVPGTLEALDHTSFPQTPEVSSVIFLPSHVSILRLRGHAAAQGHTDSKGWVWDFS